LEDKNLKIALMRLAGNYVTLGYAYKVAALLKSAFLVISYLPGNDTITSAMRKFNCNLKGGKNTALIDLMVENHKFTDSERLAFLKL
jgi:hypothetical protein